MIPDQLRFYTGNIIVLAQLKMGRYSREKISMQGIVSFANIQLENHDEMSLRHRSVSF